MTEMDEVNEAIASNAERIATKLFGQRIVELAGKCQAMMSESFVKKRGQRKLPEAEIDKPHPDLRWLPFLRFQGLLHLNLLDSLVLCPCHSLGNKPSCLSYRLPQTGKDRRYVCDGIHRCADPISRLFSASLPLKPSDRSKQANKRQTLISSIGSHPRSFSVSGQRHLQHRVKVHLPI